MEGTCYPFVQFNLCTNVQIDFLEIPLVIMNGAFFAHARSVERAWEVSKKLIDAVERDKGVLTLL